MNMIYVAGDPNVVVVQEDAGGTLLVPFYPLGTLCVDTLTGDLYVKYSGNPNWRKVAFL